MERAENDAAVSTALDAVETAIATGDVLTAQQEFELALTTAVASQLGSSFQILSESQQWARKAAEASIHAQIESYKNEAAIRTEQIVRNDGNVSLASQITTLTANLASTDAAVLAEQTARADGDTALASSISTVSTTVAGHTTTLTEYGNSIDGISAEWGVDINANGEIVGAVRLDAGDSESTFTVVSDTFRVAQPGLAGGAKTVFQVGTVTGVGTTVALAGNMLVDGAIIAQHLSAGSVTTAKLAAGAVTADKITASTLSAITANVGTVTAGVLRSSDSKFVIDLTNKTLTIET